MALFKKKQKNLRPSLQVARNEGVQNAVDTLLANIRFSEVDTPIKTICITSAVPNDGKTTVAIALALAAGRIGSRVCLVECDMRRRCLHSALGVKARHGLHAVATGKVQLEEAVVPLSGEENVFLLDAEQGIPNPEGLLNSKHFEQLLDQLAAAFDYVIVDTPPVAAFADASIVASKAQGTVLVVRQGVTDRREAEYAVDSLRKADANILGVSLNCQEAASGGYGYYYGYYYSYYYDEKNVPANSQEAKDALADPNARVLDAAGNPVGAATAVAPESAQVAE